MQETKEATMRENVAEPNAKRAARAESVTWTCKMTLCDKEKNRNRYSKYHGKKIGRRKQPCASPYQLDEILHELYTRYSQDDGSPPVSQNELIARYWILDTRCQLLAN